MVAASILPVTIHNGELLFLFGKECEMEKSAPGWSDFGGGVENKEPIYKAALREGSEEMMGILGNQKELGNLIKKNGGVYKLCYEDYHIHVFFLEYDENLTKYYNNIHQFVWKKMDHKLLYETRIFEKSEIDWFSINDIKTQRKSFRHFYTNMLDIFIDEYDNIYKFILSKSKKRGNRRTKKNNN